jgi:cell division septum initiation protein DivIVA
LDAEQDRINVELPRATVGGLKKGPVEELLRQIARDYATLEQENRKLLDTLEDRDADSSDGTTVQEPARTNLEHAADAATGQLGPSRAAQSDTYELAGAVLALAQRTARDMRDSTRADCELMIKKSRAYAAQVESDAQRARARSMAELDELDALKRDLRDELRRSLEGFLQTFVAERSANPPKFPWREILSATEERRPGKRKRKGKPKPRD